MTSRHLNLHHNRRMVALDFQNLGISANTVQVMDDYIMREVDRIVPSANQELFRAYCRPDQRAAIAELDRLNWRTQSDRGDLDGAIIQQCKSFCGQDPDSTCLVLATKDGDFASLVEEMRDWGTLVYVMGPYDSSQHLKEVAGFGYWIQWPYFAPGILDYLRKGVEQL